MNRETATRYASRMEEIKRRLTAIDTIINRTHTTCWDHTNFEFVALQFRKVFEIIVLATVDANQSALPKSVFKEWDIGRIVRQVENVNPKFYPQPARQNGASVESVTDGFLTLANLKEFHGRCGDWMHSKAPDLRPIDYEEWRGTFALWRGLIVKLLNYHIVQLPDETKTIWVGMRRETTDDVFWNVMERVEPAGEAA